MSDFQFHQCPFTVVICTNESAPFQFQGISTRNPSKRKGAPPKLPVVVPIERKALWSMDRREVEIKGETHLVGYADYTIRGFEKRFQLERKSVADLYGTLSTRRGRFEAEIKRLHEDCDFAAVVVEGEWADIVRYRDSGMSSNSVIGTILAWQQRYNRVHWILAPGRAVAELLSFRHMERFWKEQNGAN